MNFELRNWRETDSQSLVKYANNFNIAKNLTNSFPYPYTAENALSFIQMAAQQQPTRLFAIVISGEAAGGIGLHPQADIQCKNAELGYWLGEPFWGNGIITKAITQITDYGFLHFDIDRIFARPFGSNIGSQRALLKAGFTLEAQFKNTFYKFGAYEDELVFAIRKTPY